MSNKGCYTCVYGKLGADEDPCSTCMYTAKGDKDSYVSNLKDEFKNKLSNGDRIRQMSDEELTQIIMCPYDTTPIGGTIDKLPCVKDGKIQELVTPGNCNKCCLDWLKRAVKPEMAAGKDEK